MLKEAIRSVLNQTFHDYEILVIDDYSTDHTEDAVGSFSDNRIIYLMNDRGAGGAGTRNAGIFRARGKWVAFLDDDDIWLPRKLSMLHAKILTADRNTGFIYTGAASYDFEKKSELRSRIPKREGWLQNDLLHKNHIGTFSAVAIRTDLLLKVGGLDEGFTALQDRELYTRVARLTKITCIKKKLSYIRVANADRISFSSGKKMQSSILFLRKNRLYINRDSKLRHKAAARIFMFAAQDGNLKETVKALPWTFAGLLVDSSATARIFRKVFLIWRARFKRFLISSNLVG